MLAQRKLVSEGSPIAKALNYNLKRWQALTRYLDDPHAPIDNNRIENLIRLWAIGRANSSFAGSLRAGQRAAAIMNLVRSAQLNAHDPYAYLKDVLTQLRTQRADKIAELRPHNWTNCPLMELIPYFAGRLHLILSIRVLKFKARP